MDREVEDPLYEMMLKGSRSFLIKSKTIIHTITEKEIHLLRDKVRNHMEEIIARKRKTN